MVAPGTVSKILSAQPLRPHKAKCFLERRDPEFDAKMAQVPHVYKEVKLPRERGKSGGRLRAYVSHDEKPASRRWAGPRRTGRRSWAPTPRPGATTSTSGTAR